SITPSFVPRRAPPLCSTLFPYTTLFRSVLPLQSLQNAPAQLVLHPELVGHLRDVVAHREIEGALDFAVSYHVAEMTDQFRVQHRSEEHTSELQSLRHLVCRLLLEKKKKT